MLARMEAERNLHGINSRDEQSLRTDLSLRDGEGNGWRAQWPRRLIPRRPWIGTGG